MKTRRNPLTAEVRGQLAALRRAAKSARKLAEDTGTPFYVWQNGRVVNLNPRRGRKVKR